MGKIIDMAIAVDKELSDSRMIDFNEITIPYLTGKITREEWIDTLYGNFILAVKEMIKREEI